MFRMFLLASRRPGEPGAGCAAHEVSVDASREAHPPLRQVHVEGDLVAVQPACKRIRASFPLRGSGQRVSCLLKLHKFVSLLALFAGPRKTPRACDRWKRWSRDCRVLRRGRGKRIRSGECWRTTEHSEKKCCCQRGCKTRLPKGTCHRDPFRFNQSSLVHRRCLLLFGLTSASSTVMNAEMVGSTLPSKGYFAHTLRRVLLST
jgi:hypothetical protein